MVRKLKELAGPQQDTLVDAVLTSAQQIWVAGLGAFARAQKEGSELFDKLVQEGGELQKLSERLAPEKSFLAGGAMSRLAENVGKQASGSLDKLEKAFEDRVAHALRRLGVPSRDEVESLSREVAELKAKLAAARMQSAKTAARKSAAKSAAKPAGKAAAKLAAKGVALKGTRAASKRAARVSH
jgi:poly(hydroxyalkanoate) granule-associated protein